MIAKIILTSTLCSSIGLLSGCSHTENKPKMANWHCEASSAGQWLCGNNSTPKKSLAILTDTQSTNSSRHNYSAPVTTSSQLATSTAGHANTLATHKIVSPIHSTLDLHRLHNTPGNYYAVQLGALSQTNSINKYLDFYAAYQPLVVSSNTSNLQLIIENIYPDYASAQRAVASYPTTKTISLPWIRKLSSLRQSLR